MTSDQIEPDRRPGRAGLVFSLAVLVLGVAVLGIYLWWERADREERAAQRRCAPGITRIVETGECYGVSDGTYRFVLGDRTVAAELDRIQDLIARENQAVGTQPHFTVVYAMPMPYNGQGTFAASSVLRHLFGAYAAQSVANQSAGTPRVRLEVANFGHDGVGWQQVARNLVDPDRAEPVAVVTGFGQSLENTKSLAGALSGAGIPMVGATITADDLNGRTYPNLYRVGPNNSEQIAAAIDHLRRTIDGKDLDRVNGVYLIASGKAGDSYVQELTRTFRAAIRNSVAYTYDPGEGGWEQALQSFAGNICTSRPAAVYFAGRSAELAGFLVQLHAQCDPRAGITVMTGDDASNLAARADPALSAALGGGVELLYTGLAHPQAWGGRQFPEMAKLVDTLQRKDIELDYSDGGTMMAYDAVSLAAQATRWVTGATPPAGRPGTLINGFAHYNQDTPWCGASGPIALITDDTGRRGDTRNKPIPIVQLAPGQVTRFQSLYQPGGTPLPHCTPR